MSGDDGRAAGGYDGAVAVGGPAQRRKLPGLTVTKIAVGPYDNNAYLLRCTGTGEGLLVDAAAEPDRLLALAGDEPPPRTVVTTHRHRDHWQALRDYVTATGARTVAHPLDAPEIPVPTEQTVEQGDTLHVGEVTLHVIHLRGHTPGSIALRVDAADRPHLFTGDSLFPGGPGNTERDQARFASLMDDLEERVFGPLPDLTWVYPGHGRDTTLGAERSALPEWRARGW